MQISNFSIAFHHFLFAV